MMHARLRAVLGWAGVAAVWLLVWFAVARAVDLELLLPAPQQVAVRLGELARTADFWLAAGASFGRVMLGTVCALAVGTLLAVGGALVPALRKLFSPLLGVIKSTPVASFILLALVWLERSILPAFMAALIVLPVIWGNLDTGIASVGRELRELAQVYRLNLGLRLKRIYLPAVMPYFVSACRTSLGMAWKAGIAAEVLCIPPLSIGSRLHDAKVYLETTDLFAWTLTVILLSLLIEYLLMALLARAGRAWNSRIAQTAALPARL